MLKMKRKQIITQSGMSSLPIGIEGQAGFNITPPPSMVNALNPPINEAGLIFFVRGAIEPTQYTVGEALKEITVLSKVWEQIPVKEFTIFNPLTESNTREIRQKYQIVNEIEVLNFISENAYLLDALLEAPQNIQEIFGKVQLQLNLYTDPEEGWETLVITIKSNKNFDEKQKLHRNLLENWFAEKMHFTHARLNVKTE